MLVKSVTIGFGAALVLAGSAWLALAQGPAAPAVTDPASPAASPLPVTFTIEQVSIGRSAYGLNCAGCHGDTPPSVPSFMRTVVSDLYDFISVEMPADAPGSLPSATYAAIVAFFLRNTGYPPGTEPLPEDSELLARMSLAP